LVQPVNQNSLRSFGSRLPCTDNEVLCLVQGRV
jgi:hypothetical protein